MSLQSGREQLAGRAALLAGVALAAALSLRVRFRAWPEVLVPSYLWGRGWMLYRDIKVVHSPLLIAFLAGVYRAVGFGARTLRVLGLLPVAAILIGLRRYGRGRGWSVLPHASAALLFVLTFFAWDGNAIYPEVFLAALAVPIYSALRRGEDRDFHLAGWLFGVALSIKQPAVFAFLFASAWIAFHRVRRLPSFLARAAAVPSLFFLSFLAAGAGRDFLRWTLEVPFVYYRGRTSLGIQTAQAEIALAGALSLAVWMLLAVRRSEERGPAILLGGLTAAFGMPAFPHFEMVHLVAAVPLLAVAAGEVLMLNPCGKGGPRAGLRGAAARFAHENEAAAHVQPRGRFPSLSPLHMERGGRQAGVRSGEGKRTAAVATIAVGLSILLNAAYLATDTSAGEMSFWSSKEDDAAVARLAALPPSPLFLYGVDQNLFIRSGRVPPAGFYSNPDLWVHYLVDGLEEEQIRILRSRPDTVVLRGRGVPRETPRRLLPTFLATRYSSEEFVPGRIRRLRPLSAP